MPDKRAFWLCALVARINDLNKDLYWTIARAAQDKILAERDKLYAIYKRLRDDGVKEVSEMFEALDRRQAEREAGG